MDNDTLNVAAKLTGEVISLVNGYDKRKKHPEIKHFRRFTIDDVKRLDEMHGTIWFQSNQGDARQCRKSSGLKTWKRDPERFECSFKYGMYESFRMDTRDMLNRLLVELD